MKKLIKNTALSVALAFTAMSAQAQDDALIKGYFRIQNVGNENYVEVTGPFTAKPNLTYQEAENSAGTIMYVEAVQDGDSYRLTHLRCQGIDVAEAEVIDPDEYDKLLGSLLNNGINGDIAYALVREGFKYGYTSIARATVGTVFWFVASKLEGHTGDDVNSDNYIFDENDYINVARDFNREVTSKLDLGIRMMPVRFEDKTVQVYFDVPSLQPVCDWYLNKDVMFYEESIYPVSRHEIFASAMRSMHHYLVDEKGIDLETFTEADIKLFKEWGYDITTKYPAENGLVKLNFDKIFSDPILLFNWIKMVGYYILNPGENDHGLSGLGFSGLADKAKNHYLTSLLVDYLPRLHYNTRAFLIDGRVGEADSFGGAFDASQSGTLGFAGEYEVGNAGDHAVWKLCPMDNNEQKFVVKHKHSVENTVSGREEFEASALCFDFPVSAADTENTTFYDLTPQLYATTINDYVYVYNKVLDLDEIDEIQKPFLMKTTAGGDAQLNVADGEWTFEPLTPTEAEPDPVPDNSFVFSDEETVDQYSAGSQFVVYATGDNDGASTALCAMKGVLLPTSLTNNDLSDMWGLDKKDIYSFNNYANHVGFSNPDNYDVNALEANEAVYLPSTSPETIIYEDPEEGIKSLEKSFAYIGEPVSSTLSGIENVSVEQKVEDNVLYDLRGIRVDRPQPGSIYIFKGRKYIAR